MLRSVKQNFVENLEGLYRKSDAIIVTHYRGLSVTQINDLRKVLRPHSVGFCIVKNTLARIAANNAGIESLADMFNGPIAIGYSNNIVAAAKYIAEFAKTNDNLKILGGIIDGRLFDSQAVQLLATMPSMDNLRSQIIGLLLSQPRGVAGIIQSPMIQLVNVLKAYATKNNEVNI